MPIQSVLVLGAGSAGLLAALGLRKKLPNLAIRIVRSPELGVIGVGESTTPNFPNYVFEYLGIPIRDFFATALPTWKVGIHFLWGKRPWFNYGFSRQLDAQLSTLPRSNGYYCDEDFTCVDVPNALMEQNKVYLRDPTTGGPKIDSMYGFHLDNHRLVAFLESIARARSIEIIDAKVQGAQRGPAGISAVVLEDGRQLSADLYIDASGFRSQLLGHTLEEPFQSFSSSLFNDRAIVGHWPRTSETILPYTTAETMDAGWCWRIDHEDSINRGYVYSSAAISDDHARAEFLAKNPLAKTWDHVVKFRTGRLSRAWVDNVVAIGNASGFVEPLESSGLMMVCWQTESLITCLEHCGTEPTPSMRSLYNRAVANSWDEVRNFLALHFKTNTRLDNPYWKRCQHETDVSALADLLAFYDQNGPTPMCREFLQQRGGNFYGTEGILVILVGTRHPYRGRHSPTPEEWTLWNTYRAGIKAQTQNALDVRETLATLRHPNWKWRGER